MVSSTRRRSHGAADPRRCTCAGVLTRFSRQPGPRLGYARSERKILLLSPKRMAPCSRAIGPPSHGCRWQAAALLCRPRHRGFRGSRVFALPREKVGAAKKDAKKMSLPRSSPPHAPSQPSRCRRASRRARAEGLARASGTSGSCHPSDPTNY